MAASKLSIPSSLKPEMADWTISSLDQAQIPRFDETERYATRLEIVTKGGLKETLNLLATILLSVYWL